MNNILSLLIFKPIYNCKKTIRHQKQTPNRSEYIYYHLFMFKNIFKEEKEVKAKEDENSRKVVVSIEISNKKDASNP